jgi:hypothetical protein
MPPAMKAKVRDDLRPGHADFSQRPSDVQFTGA